MWDNPRLLNIAAGVVVGVGAAAALLIALHWAASSALFPVREIELTTAPSRTTKGELEAAVRGCVRGNFFAVELPRVRASVEALPWVRRVEVRRLWPDRLQLALEEHVALARWGESALVNTYGERFQGRSDAALPAFAGPLGMEGEVARRYARFARIVAPLGRLARVELTERYAWQLGLESGLQIMLGRDAEAGEERLANFVETYRAGIEEMLPGAQYVDLRYPNGFAVRTRLLSG